MLFGWDISTAIIGCAVFDNDCRFLAAHHCDLRKIDDLNEKADAAENFVHEVIFEGMFGGTTHYVEDRLAGMGRGSNAGTIMKLAAFNAMVSWMVWRTMQETDGLVRLHPSSVKAVMKRDGLIIPKGSDKKELTLGFVRQREATFPYATNRNGKPQPYCYDQADAYITARAGFLLGKKTGKNAS